MQDMKEEFNKDGNIGEKQSEIAKNEKHSEGNARLCGKSQHRMAEKRTEFLGLETLELDNEIRKRIKIGKYQWEF